MSGKKVKPGDLIKITGFNCGKCAQQRFCHMGILCGKIVRVHTIQPFGGPVTIMLSTNYEISIGRGLFDKLEYEVIE